MNHAEQAKGPRSQEPQLESQSEQGELHHDEETDIDQLLKGLHPFSLFSQL